MSALNLTPTSSAPGSCSSSTAGAVPPAMVHGQAMLTVTLGESVSTLPESSVARAMIVAAGEPWAFHVYDHEVVPVAGCQVAPPSVETSTPATTPPVSVAVPVIVTLEPSETPAPADGLVIVASGAALSVDCVTAV